MKTVRITLYSSRNCRYCRQARQYLRDSGLRFQELDVQQNLRAQRMLEKMGARSVPVIMIGDKRVDGFNRERLDRLLKQMCLL